jgi:hypothetical protein
MVQPDIFHDLPHTLYIYTCHYHPIQLHYTVNISMSTRAVSLQPEARVLAEYLADRKVFV